MKNIRILYWVLLVLTTLIFISTIADAIFFANMRSTFEPPNEDTYLGFYTMFVHSFLWLIIVSGLFYIVRALFFILRKGHFNTESTKSFKNSGLLILLNGILYIIFQLNFINEFNGYSIYQNVQSGVFIILIGFGIYSFSEILRKGDLIQQEQDLTI